MTQQPDLPSNGSSKKLIAAIVIIVVIVAVVAGSFFLTNSGGNSPSPTPTATPTPSVTQSPSPTPTPTPEAATVSVLSVSYYYAGSDSFDVVGEVQNNLKTNVKNVEIIVTFYDTSGNFLAADSTTTEIEILKPNQKSPFKLTGYISQDLASYGVSVQYTETQDQPFQGLTITNQTASIDPEGLHNVVGKVKNNGAREATHVIVVCTYYDSTGTVIGTSFAYTDPATIKAGATASFMLTSYPQALTPANYEIQVQGR